MSGNSLESDKWDISHFPNFFSKYPSFHGNIIESRIPPYEWKCHAKTGLKIFDMVIPKEDLAGLVPWHHDMTPTIKYNCLRQLSTTLYSVSCQKALNESLDASFGVTKKNKNERKKERKNDRDLKTCFWWCGSHNLQEVW